MTKVTEKEEPGAASKKPSLTACLCTRTFIKKPCFFVAKLHSLSSYQSIYHYDLGTKPTFISVDLTE